MSRSSDSKGRRDAKRIFKIKSSSKILTEKEFPKIFERMQKEKKQLQMNRKKAKAGKLYKTKYANQQYVEGFDSISPNTGNRKGSPNPNTQFREFNGITMIRRISNVEKNSPALERRKRISRRKNTKYRVVKSAKGYTFYEEIK